jgi:hypothetical protein
VLTQRRPRRLLVVLAATLVLGAVPVASAVASAPLDGETVMAGLYPTAPDFDGDLAAAIAWGGPVSFAGHFHVLNENVIGTSLETTTIGMLSDAWRNQTTPFSNVEFAGRAAALAAGDHDTAVRTWAGHVRRWLEGEDPPGEPAPAAGRSLIIAPLQEMNGDWTPYGCYRDGGRLVTEHAAYRDAFRRFVSLVEGELTPGQRDRVRWSFAPNGWTTPGCGTIADFYPGDDVVDIVGISAFNFGTGLDRWISPAATVQPWIDLIRRTIPGTRDTPFLLAQTGTSSAGGDKDVWIAGLVEVAAADPNLVGFVWFNIDTVERGVALDWRCCPGPYPAWPAAVAGPLVDHIWPIDAWFAPGPLPFAPVNRVPVAAPDAATVAEGASVTIRVTANDTDGNTDPLEAVIEMPPAHGTATPAPGGNVVYRHDDSDTLSDSFTYRASDGRSTSAPVTVSITVTPVDDAPRGFGLFDPSRAAWHLRTPAGTTTEFLFGNPGDVPFVGDWDCDGIDTPGLYRRSDGFVYLRNSNTTGIADIRFFFGNPGDLPLAGDFDGNGCDTVSLYRPSEARFYIVNRLGTGDGGLGRADYSFVYGNPNDLPFVGDWDGDGDDTPGLHRPTTGEVHLRNTNGRGAADLSFVFGDPGDRMVAADWTGDRRDTPGVFRPATSTMYLRHVNAAGNADAALPWGEPGWIPVAGRFS